MASTLWADLTLCNYSDITDRMSEVGALAVLPEDNAEGLQALAQNKRDGVVKTLILEDLQITFQERYPGTVAKWLEFAQSIIENKRARARANIALSGVNSITPPVGYYTVYDGLLDIDFNDFTALYANPRTFYFSGTPVSGTSGTYAGQAASGAFLVDGTNTMLYINRGTLASPTWSRFIAKDLKDYISNPTCLTSWAADLTLVQLATDGLTRQRMRGRNDEQTAFLMAMLTDILKPNAKESRKRALQLIDVDLSGDGIISDFEASVNQSTDYFS